MTIETPLWMQGGTYAARLDRLVLAQLRDEGVMDLTCFKVTQRAAGANFTVDVSIGEAIVQGDDQANQGNYMVRCTAVESGTIGAAPGSNSRIDLVGLRMNDPNAGGNAGNTGTIVVTAGTVAASPVAPATPASTLALAYVTVAAGQASVLDANITDARVISGHRCAPGIMNDFTGPSTAVPNGWLMAFGQAVSRTTYARLFSIIGTTYGVGDGSTTFNLPDFRARTGFGLDNMGGTDAGRLSVANTLGLTGGAELHTLSTGEMPTHTHVQDAHSHNSVASGNFVPNGSSASTRSVQSGASFTGIPDLSGTSYSTATSTVTSTNQNAGSSAAHNNMPPYVLLNKIIRT